MIADHILVQRQRYASLKYDFVGARREMLGIEILARFLSRLENAANLEYLYDQLAAVKSAALFNHSCVLENVFFLFSIFRNRSKIGCCALGNLFSSINHSCWKDIFSDAIEDIRRQFELALVCLVIEAIEQLKIFVSPLHLQVPKDELLVEFAFADFPL